MKDIKAILADVELEDDAKESIIKAVNENYKTVEEWKKKTDRISELETQNEALTEQVGNLEGDSEEVENLRKQVEDFKAAEEKRKTEETENAKRESFRTVFNAAIGDKEFANDIVRDSVFEKVYAKCSAETGVSAEDAIKALTDDADGVWKNPQQEAAKMPNPADISNKKSSSDDAKKTFADMIFSAGR